MEKMSCCPKRNRTIWGIKGSSVIMKTKQQIRGIRDSETQNSYEEYSVGSEAEEVQVTEEVVRNVKNCS